MKSLQKRKKEKRKKEEKNEEGGNCIDHLRQTLYLTRRILENIIGAYTNRNEHMTVYAHTDTAELCKEKNRCGTSELLLPI